MSLLRKRWLWPQTYEEKTFLTSALFLSQAMLILDFKALKPRLARLYLYSIFNAFKDNFYNDEFYKKRQSEERFEPTTFWSHAKPYINHHNPWLPKLASKHLSWLTPMHQSMKHKTTNSFIMAQSTVYKHLADFLPRRQATRQTKEANLFFLGLELSESLSL